MKKSRKIKIKLHKALYRYSAINKAAGDFEKIGEVNIRREKEYYHVTIDNKESVKELLLMGNFLNYALMLSKSKVC